MNRRLHKGLLLLQLAVERGVIPRERVDRWRAEAQTLLPEEEVADWLVRENLLTARQVAELRGAVDALDSEEKEGLRAQALAGQSQEFPTVEGYRVTGRLGEGGMGVVWRATQLGTRREVALKLLGAHAFGSQRGRKRFEREVQLTAQLEHANIGRVYDSGLYQGVYYYAMELIHGVPLDRYARQKDLSHARILDVMCTVCEAVEHAHQRGIVHRDLKPSNILVTDDGQPHVVDFGLAKTLGTGGDCEGLMVSMEGDVAGTPAYMSPEQAAGHPDRVDTRSDVYSLGIIIFELLTGQSPRDLSGTQLEVLNRIQKGEMKRPRDVGEKMSRELEAILVKAMSLDPASRYSTAGELGRDINNYLQGGPTTATLPLPYHVLYRVARRYAVPAAVCALGLILLGLKYNGGLQPLELAAYDAFLSLRVTGSLPESPVTVIGITEQDIKALGHYPVNDREMAGLLRGIAGKGARVVGIDIFRDIDVPPGRDELNSVLLDHPEIFAVMQLGGREKGIKPPAVLEGSDRVGFADQVVDPDGVVRRGLLFASDESSLYYSLAVRVALAYLDAAGIVPESDEDNPDHLKLGRVTLPPFEPDDGPYVNADAAGYQILLDYRRPAGFPTFSLTDVREGRLSEEAVRDRIVLIGVMADSVKDYINTPLSPAVHGVEMQGLCVDQLLWIAQQAQAPIRSPREWQEFVWIVAFVGLGGVAGLYARSMRRFLLVGAGGTVAILTGAYVLFCLGWWVPVVPPVVGWCGAWLLTGPYRRQERRGL